MIFREPTSSAVKGSFLILRRMLARIRLLIERDLKLLKKEDLFRAMTGRYMASVSLPPSPAWARVGTTTCIRPPASPCCRKNWHRLSGKQTTRLGER